MNTGIDHQETPSVKFSFAVPELPSVIRYYDDFLDKTCSIRNPSEENVWSISKHGTIETLDFRNFIPELRPLMKHWCCSLIQSFALSTARSRFYALRRILPDDLCLVIATPPTEARSNWHLLLAKDYGAHEIEALKLNQTVRTAVKAGGKSLLYGTRDVARQVLRVDELVVNADGIDLEQLLPAAGLSVRIGNKEVGLDKLGTGHQSSVILKLYRQLGEGSDKFVLYLFEEPDNHLHPTSLREIAVDLSKCAEEGHSQVFLTTHSPYLLNQFDHHSVLPLASDSARRSVKRPKNLTRSDREVRIALGKYGLKPAEALLANKVVVVEGPNDVTFLRTLIELQTGITADKQDILIVSAGGKGPVGDLAGFLRELGANWQAFFDWDATESTSAPLFRDGLATADIVALQAAAATIRAELRNQPTKASKATKIVDSMLTELANPPVAGAGFAGSILDAFVRKNTLLSAAEINVLAEAIRRRQPKNISKVLSPKNIWLWSGAIEQVILRSVDAENDTEAVLRGRGALLQTFPNPTERLVAITKIIHNSAHEPDLVRDVVETLWRAGRFDHSEVKTAIKFVVG